MSKDDIYNKLCEIFFSEEVRLNDQVELIHFKLRQSKFDKFVMVEYIQAVAVRDYFRRYMLDVLHYLQFFGD